MSDQPLRSLADCANDLDRHALDLIEMDDYEGAKLAIETAMLLEQRQSQLDTRETNAAIVDRNTAEDAAKLDKIRSRLRPILSTGNSWLATTELARAILAIAGDE